VSGPNAKGYDPLKRALDVVVSGLGIVVLSPVLLATAIAIGIKLGLPVLFRQARPGRDERIFTLYKFRSMKVIDSGAGSVSDAQRLTPFGRALRATSLDELPTLWNVLKGDMSLVGPRPLLVDYLDLYSPEQARRHAVRPGITGLAQVSGRNDVTWERKLALDVEYVDTRTMWGDVLIVGATVGSVVRRSGISTDGHATSPRFLGNSSSVREPREG
jgi:lipopolysaccharide/colanic/teichoic acid biosynthesis glycosyltransferase